MKTSQYFQSQKQCVKLASTFLLAPLVLFLFLTLRIYGFEESTEKLRTSSEYGNIVKEVRRSLKSSVSSPDQELIEESASIAVKKHSTQIFLKTFKSKKVERKLRQAVDAKADFSITNLETFTSAYNQYKDPQWQLYGRKLQRQQQPSEYTLLQYFRRKSTNIKQRNPLSNSPKTSLQLKEESLPSKALFKQIKMLWNIFEFFTWIWNALAEYAQNSQRQPQQQQQQQQQPKLQKQTSINLLPQRAQLSSEISALKTNFSRLETNGEVQLVVLKGPREKRQAKDAPLKSYYDFIIVEASHKFWSIFEIASIVIVIYSIFAALYFAKLNPLVSKHDYIDYLSGDTYFGNSRHANDIDFDDNDDEGNDEDNGDDDAKTATIRNHATHYDWLPGIGHSIKFILDAIDKLPADLGQE